MFIKVIPYFLMFMFSSLFFYQYQKHIQSAIQISHLEGRISLLNQQNAQCNLIIEKQNAEVSSFALQKKEFFSAYLQRTKEILDNINHSRSSYQKSVQEKGTSEFSDSQLLEAIRTDQLLFFGSDINQEPSVEF